MSGKAGIGLVVGGRGEGGRPVGRVRLVTRDGGSSWNVCKGKFALSSYRWAVDDEGPTQRNGLLVGEGSESATRRRDEGTSTSEEKTGLGAKLSQPSPAGPRQLTNYLILTPACSSLLHSPQHRLRSLVLLFARLHAFCVGIRGLAVACAVASVAARRPLGLRAPTRPGLGDAGDGHMTVPTARSPSPSQRFLKLCLALHGPAELVAQPSSSPPQRASQPRKASAHFAQRPASFPPARHDNPNMISAMSYRPFSPP